MLIERAPAGWTRLGLEFDSAALPPVATASVTGADSVRTPLTVPAEAYEALNEYQVRSRAAGAAWRRLVIDCRPDGRLSMQTDPAGPVHEPKRWYTWVLATITAGCSVAAAVVFAVGWRTPVPPPVPPPPPRAAMIDVPPPSPREQEAFEVLKRWYDAENRADGAALRALACAHPGKNVEDEIEGFEQTKTVQGISYLEAVVGFRDEGDGVWGKFMLRVHPLTERDKQLVEQAQQHGGYFSDEYTLVSEGGQLKVCDADTPPRV
ncbi:hypothetical protein Mkiyose1665_49200 [Mycobacterium kiyosense]|uniref:Uncharacterized protein n=2 Tax=Mycobacteriaceae TaxID=1762 RepID=A0A9P3UZP1_9MYCO|nr:hypothetical protein IWGMT90018_41590 [Mycobacterium kiyosense]BDE15273.1 hypothetical protein MKCMC460_41330 [Mycobacterium sp. 20KCMC460]GLB84503.1 hypothetical protein SRL2020028_37590 [Mycobacterium kiyosense]GLB91864.1 hypothetical protein SRL2020130_46810 [Mycobacterium kiyosense]GLB97937.1 hypothetical protein SRL2020226_47130 [Mycobacterium kiyosense]